MLKEGACVHQVRCSSVARRPERAVGEFSARVDVGAPLEACSVTAAISVGFSLAPPAKAQASRFPW